MKTKITDIDYAGAATGQAPVFDGSKMIWSEASGGGGGGGGGSGSDPTPHKFWRVFIPFRSGMNYAYAIAELQFRETVGGPTVTTGGNAFSDGSNASNAFDGNPSTWWVANFGGGSYDANRVAYLGYEFATEVAIKEIMWQARNDSAPNQLPFFLFIQYSDDGIAWTTAWSCSYSGTPVSAQQYVSSWPYGKGGSSGGGGSLIEIASWTAAGGETSHTFSSIPQTYNDLILIGSGRVQGTGGATPVVTLNGLSSNIYDIQRAYWNGGGGNADQRNNWPRWDLTVDWPGTATAVGYHSGLEMQVLSYTSAAFKYMSFTGRQIVGSGPGAYIIVGNGQIRTTDPITSLTIAPNSGQFAAGTKVTLYGRGGTGGSGGGSSKPWYWDPPKAADLVLASADATQLILTDDDDVGLMVAGNTPVAGDIGRIAYKTLTTPSGNWVATLRMNWMLETTNFAKIGMFVQDSVGGRSIGYCWHSGASDQLEKARFNTLTGYNSSVIYGMRGYANWLQIEKSGSDLIYRVSADGKVWHTYATETVTAWLANNPNRVGFGVSFVRTVQTAEYSVDVFSVTGTAV